MAACFSIPHLRALPPVYVFSRINELSNCLKAAALPGMLIKDVELPDTEILSKDQIKEIESAELGVFDPTLLVNVYKHMPKLKWAHITWAGVDPLTKLTEEPPFVITRHVSDSFSVTMAEYVICHIISCERKLKLCWKGQQTKTWLKDDVFRDFRNMDELTVGVLGVGNMGSAVAKFLKCRGTTVYGFARNPHNQKQWFDEIFTCLEDILTRCDYICNTLPNTPLTKGMLNNYALQKCTKKPVFINVGRGNIISETKLIHALKNGWFSGAVLDVFEEEPLPRSSELWNMDQVTITPHVAALSTPDNITEDFYDNLTSYMDGHGLKNVFNFSAGY